MRLKKKYLEDLKKQVNKLDNEIDTEQSKRVKSRLEEADKLKKLQQGLDEYEGMSVEEAFMELAKNANLQLMKQMPRLLSISLRTFKGTLDTKLKSIKELPRNILLRLQRYDDPTTSGPKVTQNAQAIIIRMFETCRIWEPSKNQEEEVKAEDSEDDDDGQDEKNQKNDGENAKEGDEEDDDEVSQGGVLSKAEIALLERSV